MANETVLVGQNRDTALITRSAADVKWATLMGRWHEDRYGQEVQQFIGRWVPDDDYQLSDKVATVPESEHAMGAATQAATARGKQVAPQFTKGYPYTAKRGEPSDPTEDMLREAGAAIAGWVFDAIGLESLARGARKVIRGDRLENQKILSRNLISRWREEGAAMELLGGSALRSSRVGQVGAGYERGRDAASNFTTAGFSNPLHNINVDGWNRDYKLRFFKAMGIGGGGSFASQPTMSEVSSAAAVGTNLGQVKPFDDNGTFLWKPAQPLNQPTEETSGDINAAVNSWINSIFAPPPLPNARLNQLQTELKTMKETFMRDLGPGPRIPVPFNVAINLTDLLRQNILVPPDVVRREQEAGTGSSLTAGLPAMHSLGGEGLIDEKGEIKALTKDQWTTDPTDRVFQQLYTHNANPIAPKGVYKDGDGNPRPGDKPRSPRGSIAGIPVADLQSPVLDHKGGLYAPLDQFPVFSFEEDYKRNNLDNIQRGAGDNTPSGSTAKGLGVAVMNDVDIPFDATNFVKTNTQMELQTFPFLFETVNKRGSKRSYSYQEIYMEDENGNLLEDDNGNAILEDVKVMPGVGGKEFKQYAFFQATLNSINESYNPTWSSKHFFGRTEQIHSYTMTDRTMELSFTITVDEIRKLQHLYERVLWLAQQTYASYDENGRMKAGPLIKLSIGDMFSNMTGFIRSLSYDWNYLGGSSPKWEITQGLRIPMACSVSMSFTVMHDVLPDRNHNFYPGPMMHEKGIYSARGLGPFPPFDSGVGPLISEAEPLAGKEVPGGPSEVASPNRRNEMFVNAAYINAWDVQSKVAEFTEIT